MSAIFGTTVRVEPTVLDDMAARLAHRGSSGSLAECGPHGARWGVLGRKTGLLCQEQLCVGGALGYVESEGDALETLAHRFSHAPIEAAVSMLNGCFALSVYDSAKDKTFLIRDRAGSQPLYYCRFRDGFAFSSEYKALLALPGISRALDSGALSRLVDTKLMPADRSLFDAIRQVPPGSFVVLSGDQVSASRYWHPSLNLIADRSTDACASELADLIADAVRRRLAQASAPAIALSGGVDSMLLLGAAQRANSERVRTITIGDNAEDPELCWARKIASHYGTDHQELVVDREAGFARLAELVWCLEDPIARTETLLTFQLAQLAGAGTTMIRGDGADGLFGGMQRHKLLALAGRLPVFAGDLWQLYNYSQTGQRPGRPLAWLASRVLLRQRIPPRPCVAGVEPRRSIAEAPPYDREMLNHVLAQGPLQALPMLLQKAERPSAYHGVAVSLPFTDHRILDFSLRLPSAQKNDGRRNKIALRAAARVLLPTEFANRPKFAQRITENEEFCSDLFRQVERWRVLEAMADRGVLELSNGVSSLITARRSPSWSPEEAMLVWTLLLLEIWFRTFVDANGDRAITA